MPTASLIKLSVMIAAYREADAGRLDLGKFVSLRETDKVPGSGILTEHFSAGIRLPLKDFLRLMIRYSDNTATNVVIDQIGIAKINQTAVELGCANTQLNSKLYRGDTSVDPARSKTFGVGNTTAEEALKLLQAIHHGTAASQRRCVDMMEHLKSCDDPSMIGRLLPPNVVFAHKTGAVANCRTDAGIVFTRTGPVAVCVLTNKNKDQSWSKDNEAERLMAKIGRAIIERFGSAKPSTDLQVGAFGEMVETLQRTLNERLSPSPNLSIDGDFGPATKKSLVRFQQANHLEPNGIVTKDVWKALGPLIDQDKPVRNPDLVNNEVLPTSPAPTLDSPPVVTCRSWVIGNPRDGSVLFESDSNVPLETASTTKIMTALVVLNHAREFPGVLDEVITISENADQTRGSTAGIRVDEQISVRNLLYGLLLPSGNDASVALAEHFGAKVWGNSDADTSLSNYALFVAKMNETAKKLRMTQTHYTNTHGLSDPRHVSTAADLFRLASVAMKNSIFRKIVQTRQFGCRIESTTGYARNVMWKNTNQLLKVDGYRGVKTGTTSAAGACLVAMGERNGVSLITVVLGSSSSEARYSDSRNLFRWAWAKQ